MRGSDIQFIESESQEAISLESVPEIEKIFADLLFEVWLVSKSPSKT